MRQTFDFIFVPGHIFEAEHGRSGPGQRGFGLFPGAGSDFARFIPGAEPTLRSQPEQRGMKISGEASVQFLGHRRQVDDFSPFPGLGHRDKVDLGRSMAQVLRPPGGGIEIFEGGAVFRFNGDHLHPLQTRQRNLVSSNGDHAHAQTQGARRQGRIGRRTAERRPGGGQVNRQMPKDEIINRFQ